MSRRSAALLSAGGMMSVEAAWTNRKSIPARLRNFAVFCSRAEKAGSITYIVKVEEDAASSKTERAEVFFALRRLNIDSPYMAWPYLALSGKNALGVCMIVAPGLKVWDFVTARALRKGRT